MKSNNFPYEQKGLKTSFSLYKNRKNKTRFGKNSFGKKLGGGEKKKHTNLILKKIKLRIHIKKNILSFNKCKLDII